ncbi:uncharacterized protein F4807DRAFT_40268 [Annulohypoxylon truncatum]|uniref:uncharacterized protein n=1 Tax=Annulohypoxylon truncatum TaxID=327061 RepID=UPI002008804C|nr:uncharacterized protein F4807DRAFT_40268 [Annulohypoxylon truncatum]KAI1210822.1 hypothetical protein F4807DRAFT_40268 [Annulohypoxylon truncatum]
MSTSLRPQVQMTQLPNNKGHVGGCPSLSTAPNSVTPSKRPDDDDDIQFISSQPVKRQKMAEHVAQKHNMPVIPIAPTISVAIPPTELRDSDRRISTGMVGLPSDINVMELTSALRGVSLPVLEKFVLDQPFRKPRPPSPPELSPKQLPQTVVSARLDSNVNKNGSRDPKFDTASGAYMSTSDGSVEPRTPTPIPMTPNSTTDELHVLNTPANHMSSFSPPQVIFPKEPDSRISAMPPPPIPRTEVPNDPKALSSKTTIQNTHQTDPMKHPCQVCVRMRQHTNIAQAQGFSMLHHNMPHHMIPQMACHPPYSQHFHPQMMTMGPGNMHAFSPGFPQVMMPIPGSNLAALPSHMTSPMQVTQNQEMNPPPNPEKSVDKIQPSPPSPPPPSAPESAPAVAAAGIDESPTASNPVKPPVSLIQPTYRKPSPNLIVDVAETCQEKFPFEEVAKRHNVPVGKVFDVFAAIIQVPLLRCPTDRRRAGRLATSRVKEYTRTKKAIQETGGQSNSDSKDEIVVKPSDVADRLGQVNFPDGFSPEE